MLHRVPIEVKARAEGMSGYLQRVLLELLNNLEYGLTPLRAAQMLWGNNATDANRNAIRRAFERPGAQRLGATRLRRQALLCQFESQILLLRLELAGTHECAHLPWPIPIIAAPLTI
jgi:hypothetical protein